MWGSCNDRLGIAATDYNFSRSNRRGIVAPNDVSDLIDKTKIELVSDVKREIAKQRAVSFEGEYEAVVTINITMSPVSEDLPLKGKVLTKPKADRATRREID